MGRRLSTVIAKVLDRWTELVARDYAALLHVGGDYAVMEIPVRTSGWLADQTVEGLDLRREGVILLGLTRKDGDFVGAPNWDTVLRPGDAAIIYGRRVRSARSSTGRPDSRATAPMSRRCRRFPTGPDPRA